MARIYSVSFTDIAVTADQDFFQIEAVTVPVSILSIYISQNSDVGDSAAENLTIRIRQVTDALTNVTAEVQLDQRDAAALADLNVNDTTPLTTGAATVHAETWNIAFPWIWTPPVFNGVPQELIVPVGEVITVNLVANPADELITSGTMYFAE